MRKRNKELNRKHQATWRDKNRQKHREKVKRNRERLRLRVQDYKSERGCEECGANHPAILEFHHLDPGAKDWAISDMCRKSICWERILEEIQKRRLLCRNCHAILHWNDETVGRGPEAKRS